MKDLVDVVNVAHQVKKLLKLYYLGKYSILFKLRLKLQIWNLILYLLPELLYFSKQKKKKKQKRVQLLCYGDSFCPFSKTAHVQKVGTKNSQWEQRHAKGELWNGHCVTLHLKDNRQEIYSLIDFVHHFGIVFVS